MTPETEEWRPVVGYETRYRVSSLGRIESLPMAIKRWNSGVVNRGSVILSPSPGNHGYLRVTVRSRPTKHVLAHRMVAEAFIPNPDRLPFVNHKDGNRANNAVSNLEWCTSAENLKHARDVLGTFKGPQLGKGDKCPASKLTEAQVKIIKTRICRGEKLAHLAREFGVTASAICELKAGRSWGHV